jgi:hypothetical protein
MKTQEEAIYNLIELENKFNLYNFKFWGIPTYNIIRYKFRELYILEHTGINLGHTKTPRFNLLQSIKGLLFSFYKILKLIFFRPQVNTVFLGFSRLEKVGNHFIDKFIDPVIDCAKIEDYIYFEYGKTGIHYEDRLHEDKIVHLDFVYIFSHVFGFLLSPFLIITKYRRLLDFRSALTKIITTPEDITIVSLSQKIGDAYIQYQFFNLFFHLSKTKRLLGVSRVLLLTASLAAKKRSIPVYELQHGITNGPTRLYSGYYNPDIDPDYFLTFGNYCSKDVFGIPSNRIINIGWAFKNYIQRIESENIQPKNSILIISEPHVSHMIFDCVVLLAKTYPAFNFHIRRHPREQFSKSQSEIIGTSPNIFDVSSPVTSCLAIMPYQAILGENSSVIYEALSMGKKVGRICFGGLRPRDVTSMQADGFYYLKNIEDFANFAAINHAGPSINKEIYSDFKIDAFASIFP